MTKRKVTNAFYSRNNLCVVNEIFQWIATGEMIIQICRVAYYPLVSSGRINVSCYDD